MDREKTEEKHEDEILRMKLLKLVDWEKDEAWLVAEAFGGSEFLKTLANKCRRKKD